MVVSRNDIKRKRKDNDTTLDILPESPKRTKVHAQRKFAQGSNVNSPAITPIKEIEREKVKCNEVLPSTTDLLPIKRPNTDDFLTFLCFRGTNLLPTNLNYFNTANNYGVQNEATSTAETATKSNSITATITSDNSSSQEKTDRPFIAFGVRKRADPFINNKLEKKRRHALALQALRRKYQEQRMAKIRAVTIEKQAEEGIKKKTKNIAVRTTRSVSRNEVPPRSPKKIQVIAQRVLITRAPLKSNIKRPLLKQKMCLRSRGRFIPRELNASAKKRPIKVKKIVKLVPSTPTKDKSSSEFSSDDDQPLVKTIKKTNKIIVKSSLKIAKKTAPGPKKPNMMRLTRSTLPLVNQHENSIPRRPPRKTKEAAALYMELLGRKLVNEAEIDDDDASIDSFPELPNVRRTEQREIEMKAKVKTQVKIENKITTRKSSTLTKDVKEKVLDVTKDKNIDTIEKVNIDKEKIKVVKDKINVKEKNFKKKIIKKSFSSTDNEEMDVEEKEKKENGSKKVLRSTKIETTIKSDINLDTIKKGKCNINSDKLKKDVESIKTRNKQNDVPSEKIIKTQDKIDVDVEKTKVKPIDSQIDKIKKTKPESISGNNKKLEINKTDKKTNKKVILESDKIKNDKSETSQTKKVKRKKFEADENKTVSEIIDDGPKKDCIKESKLEEDTEPIFNDSDEEPLVNLTTQKKCNKPIDAISPIHQNQGIISENTIKIIQKDNKEIKIVTKKSLSDDDDFYGFAQTKNKKNISEGKYGDPLFDIPKSNTDLLCKNVRNRSRKEKVNMSNEQIEKWLNDNVLAGECSKKDADIFEKKFDDDLKHDIKEECKTDSLLLTSTKTLEEAFNTLSKIKKEKVDVVQPIIKSDQGCNTKLSTSPKLDKNQTPPGKYTFQQRRSILSKDRKEISPNTKAFSPENESSVYAFEESEMPVNTPFRSNVRRPSSTATSQSEEDPSKIEEDEKKKQSNAKFRLPTIVKPTSIKNQGKQEVSLTLSTDEANNSASIAVQVNLDSDTGFSESNVSMECSTQTDVGDEDGGGHLFYIPLQAGKQNTTNQQIIQGVAVKLGTEGAAGTNQRLVMHAKLVTQRPPLPDKPQKPLAQTSTLMYPPVGTVQPTYRPKPIQESNKSTSPPKSSISDSSTSMEPKMIPSSPSASSSSSAKIYKRAVKPRARSLDMCVPINSTEFPKINSPAQLVEAPTFHPSEKEFQDPLEFFEKIRPIAENFGICRIIPPANFKPECKVSDDMRFTAYNQYVHKMLHRWGPNFKELMAIRKYLATQSINLTHPPWIGGMEIDLPRLYQTVQSLGGLKEVIEKKRWPKVAEGMKIPKSAQDRVTKLDDIYCKYLLPYDTLSPAERQKLFDEVESDWAKRESRNSQLAEETKNISSNSNESESEYGDDEAEECTVKGRNMALNAFYRIARNTMSMWFKSAEPSAQEVEQEFWKHVTTRQNHICVHSGSIDSSGWGYGFVCSKNSPFARHPWNLKILTNNSGSVLRSMGPVMGVTVPTLHVGMVFSSCCWYRDPHSLPWIEYLHTGARKIWYGIPDSFSSVFRSALSKIVPSYCRDKTLWLTSDTAMIPPSLLVKNGVSLCRTVQEPGQFIIVFPKAFTSSICSGYVVSESVYFAPTNWLATAQQAFKDIRDSCESSMFSLERLLMNIASDSRSNSDVLRKIMPAIEELRDRENLGRTKLDSLGLKTIERLPLPDNSNPRKKRKMQEDDGEYECEICRANLYVSLVIDSHEDSVYCLDHAVDHIKDKPEQLKHCKLLFTYNIQDIDNLIEKMKLNIETKTHIKKPARYISKATLLKNI